MSFMFLISVPDSDNYFGFHEKALTSLQIEMNELVINHSAIIWSSYTMPEVQKIPANIQTLQTIIENAYANPDSHSIQDIHSVKEALNEVLLGLESGTLRVAQCTDKETGWQVQTWLKKAILLYFRLHNSQKIDGGFSQFYDKIPLRFAGQSVEQSAIPSAVPYPEQSAKPCSKSSVEQTVHSNDFQQLQTRIVPPACVRRGAYLGPNTIVMPSFINIGAYVGEGTMVDTWATVGSCAQIGKNVHLSGGVGIGGVLEPLQSNPTIIEDNCFIGARSEIVEGVVVEENSVISMGVFIGSSTRIYNRETQQISYGRVPAGSVVVPGNLPSDDGRYSLYCAVIVKQVDAKTRQKTALNELLRI